MSHILVSYVLGYVMVIRICHGLDLCQFLKPKLLHFTLLGQEQPVSVHNCTSCVISLSGTHFVAVELFVFLYFGFLLEDVL